MNSRIWRTRATYACVPVLALLFAVGAGAQTTSSLSGTVSDPSGAVVPLAAIALTNVGTGLVENAVSDKAGRYSFPQVPTGKYKITAKAAGFNEEIVSNIEILVGTATTVNVTFLKVGSTSDTISVVADAAAGQHFGRHAW